MLSILRNNPDPEHLKWCTLGQHFVDQTNFNRNASRRDGLSNICKDCDRERGKQYHHDVRREERFGVSAEMYDAMYYQQEGRCAICKRWFDVLCVDHNHRDGHVRGLLCQDCNKALGLLRDDPDAITEMLAYLAKDSIYTSTLDQEFRSLAAPRTTQKPQSIFTRKEPPYASRY